MSELSAAEKRKILRERRQQKFSNGGASSRLNKITGQVPNSQLSADSPLEYSGASVTTKNQDGSKANHPAEGNDESTKEMDELIASVSKPSSARMTPQKTLSKSISPEMSQAPTPDPFAMLKAMQEGSEGSESPFDFLKAMQEGSQEPGTSPFGKPPADQETLNYHNYMVNNLKARLILFKWFFFLLPYVYVVIKSGDDLPFSLPTWIVNPSNFFTVFLSFEIVATSIYYQRMQSLERSNEVNTLQQNSKIAKLASLIPNEGLPIPHVRDKILMGLHYWDVLSMFITDVCFVLIMMGVFTYI